MTTLEESPAATAALPQQQSAQVLSSGGHRSLHAIKCYPSSTPGGAGPQQQQQQGNNGGTTAWDKETGGGPARQQANGHVNGLPAWNRTTKAPSGTADGGRAARGSGGDVESTAAVAKLILQVQQQQQLSYSVVGSGGGPRPIGPSGSTGGGRQDRTDRQPYRSHSERSGRWPLGSDKGNGGGHHHHHHHQVAEDDVHYHFHQDDHHHHVHRELPVCALVTKNNLCRSNSSLDLLEQQELPLYADDGSGSLGGGSGGLGGGSGGLGIGSGGLGGGSGTRLNREYGSASSIDVMSMSGESFFDLLKVYNNVEGQDQRSPGPSNMAECLRGRLEPLPVVQNAANTLVVNGLAVLDNNHHHHHQHHLVATDDAVDGHHNHQGGAAVSAGSATASSPKNKTKFHRLWEIKERKAKNRTAAGGGTSGATSRASSSSGSATSDQQPSIFRKLRGSSRSGGSDGALSSETGSSKGSDHSLDAEGRHEEKLRKKAFAHYDVQSVTANLTYAVRLRSILGLRRNTTTGASAASMSTGNGNNGGGSRTSSTPAGSTEDLGGAADESDFGDGRSNDLVLSCPFFRNELGGEDERVVSLTRTAVGRKARGSGTPGGGLGTDGRNLGPAATGGQAPAHRPNFACGLSILEGANELHWKTRMCPYQRHALQRENVDHGALYYKDHFLGRDHQNWFGMDELLGPVAVSIRREKLDDAVVDSLKESSSSGGCGGTTTTTLASFYQYRLIIRTSELATLRGTVLEDAIPNLKHGSGRAVHTREVLEYVAPEVQLSCLRLGTTGSQTEDQLLKLDQQGLTNHYKVGILYCRAGQSTEEEMYNNEHSSAAFDEFLDLVGQRVRLKGFDKYRAQLDNKTDSTGMYSVYSTTQDSEIMFHVSTMLPYTPNNRQQLLRKRHIGNDIVTIVFQEPDALPFTPRNIRSHFQHVFIVVRVHDPCTDNTRYSLVVSRSKDVPMFGPPIPERATFPKSKAFVDFLLAKVVNAENAAHRSDKFATMATRTRQEYLKDLATNHVTTTTIDTGPKFPMLSFGGRKKDRSRPRFIPDSFVRGAIVWQVQIDAEYSRLDCFLGISGDTLVLVDEKNRDVVFACPCASVLAWSSQTSSLRVFYHQGECIVLRTRDPDVDEIQEIVSRLSCVTKGCETQELTLRRNNLGQLGFHVQQDGLITEVESQGHAFEAGLRQNSRLVEICKIVVATLSYDQMVDLLKTSVAVVVTVVPAASDDSPRRGCSLHNCSYLSLGGGHGSGSGGDYENIDAEDAGGPSCRSGKSSPRQQVALQTAPKGSSHQQYDRSSSPTRSTPSSGYGSRKSVTVNLEHRFRNNEMTSASSQSSEEKWYDLGEMTDTELRGRSGGGGGRGGQALPLTTGSGGHRQQQHYGHHQRHHHHGNSQPDRGESSSSPPPPPLPARSSSSATAFHQASLSTSGSYGSGQAGSSRNRRGGGDFQQQSPSPPSTLSPSAAPQHHGGGRSAARDYSSCSGSNYAHLVPSSSHHGSAEEGLDDCASGLGGGSPAAGLGGTGSGNYCRVGGGPLSTSVSSYAIGSTTSDQLVHERLHRLRASASGAANDDRMHPSAVAHHLAIVKPSATASSSLSSSSSFSVSVESGGSLDRCNGSRSEDELSGSSGNSLSPRTRKRRPLPPCGSTHPPPPSNGEMTSSGVHHGRSGMQNPRAGSRTVSSSHSGDEAKMMASRPTAGPSSYRPYVNGSSSLGGGPAAESTFQEDLLKLINPDLIASENSSQGGLASSGDCFVRPRTPPPIPSRTNSLDRISKEIQQQQQHRKHHHHHQLSAPSSRGGSSADKDSPPSMVSSDVILTTARPATVISTNSSPAPGDHHRVAALAAAAAARDERLSPRATVGVQGTLASKSLSSLPTTPTICPLQDDEDGDDLDWPSLAESTSKAMEEVPGVSAASSVTTTTFNSLIPWIDDVSDRLGLDPLRASTRSPLLVGHGSHRIRELESKIRVLEEDLVKEKNRKAALELEVKRLRDENSRLQEESHTAAAQLRRFTEWFFQSMDKL